MKLYVINPVTKRKVYLKIIAHSRTELRRIIKKDNFIIRGTRYSINDIIAENDPNSASSGAVLGGIIGLLGGPIGVAIGATAGGLLGNTLSDDDKKKVKSFNRKRHVK